MGEKKTQVAPRVYGEEPALTAALAVALGCVALVLRGRWQNASLPQVPSAAPYFRPSSGPRRGRRVAGPAPQRAVAEVEEGVYARYHNE
jgi:hypothetical protein